MRQRRRLGRGRVVGASRARVAPVRPRARGLRNRVYFADSQPSLTRDGSRRLVALVRVRRIGHPRPRMVRAYLVRDLPGATAVPSALQPAHHRHRPRIHTVGRTIGHSVRRGVARRLGGTRRLSNARVGTNCAQRDDPASVSPVPHRHPVRIRIHDQLLLAFEPAHRNRRELHDTRRHRPLPRGMDRARPRHRRMRLDAVAATARLPRHHRAHPARLARSAAPAVPSLRFAGNAAGRRGVHRHLRGHHLQRRPEQCQEVLSCSGHVRSASSA